MQTEEKGTKQPNTESDSHFSETKNSTNTSALVLAGSIIVFIAVGAVAGYVYIKGYNPEEAGMSEAEQQEQFNMKIQEAGTYLESGDTARAIEQFRDLEEQAQTSAQEGYAKLNLGVARLGTNRIAAVELLKEVSTNEEYADLTRAKAVNYVVNEYNATKNESFAREHIFTGSVWGDFLQEGENLTDASLNAFEYSVLITPTPEAAMRVAVDYGKKMDAVGATEEERDEYAQNIIENVEKGESAIQEVIEGNRVQYGDTHSTELALAYQEKALALDPLYFHGYIDDPQRVEDAFQDAINTLLENRATGTRPVGSFGTELYTRYHLADFLLRLDENREEGIQKVLTPFEHMTSSHNIGEFFNRRLNNNEYDEQNVEMAPARSENIIRLADISPEFRNALLEVGISENTLEQ